jgi:hypothetical protein
MSTSEHRVTRRVLLSSAAVGATASVIATNARPAAAALARTATNPTSPPAHTDGEPMRRGSEVPTAWFDLALMLVRTTPGFSPPVAARAFAYLGIAANEAIAGRGDRPRSLAGALPGLTALARLAGNGDLRSSTAPAAVNAALARLSRLLFPTTSAANLAAIEALETKLAPRPSDGRAAIAIDRAVRWGQRIAEHVFAWSTTDGGHEGYAHNFPTDYVPPTGPGMWVPTPPAFQRALQPRWGANRCMVIGAGDAVQPVAPTPYSVNPASVFFDDAMEVFDTVNALTNEQRAIALFWSDDPAATSTPPGHWISIATQVLRAERASLLAAVTTYAAVGIAVNDAFVSCWSAKYRFNLLRPVTFIQALIEPTWLPLLTTPPFPEHPSGHSVQSAAAAAVLTERFGDRYAFDDHTHHQRGLPPRSFASFNDAAAEAAISRLYGGIHFRPAVELGIEQGRSIGAAVNALLGEQHDDDDDRPS